MNNLNLSDSMHNSSMKKPFLGSSHISDRGNSPGYFFGTDKKYGAADSFDGESSGSLKYMSKNLNS